MENSEENTINEDSNKPSSMIETTKSSVNEEKISRTLDIIQSSSVRTKEVYKALTYIRTKVVECQDGIKVLQKSSGLKCLLKVLSHNNEDIINITLSILGNLCGHLIMNEEFREELVKSKIAGRIVAILRKTSNIQVQKRICRLIGNLSQANSVGRELHTAGVSHAVIHVLSTVDDTEVQHMAIRALRWLWQVDKYCMEMVRGGAVKAVANHMSSKDPEVERAVLRALVKFTQQCTQLTAEQMYGTGTGYSEIVSKLDQPVIAVLVCNLSYDPRARIELCKAGLVPAIINRLEEGKINSYLISGLCLMCREPMVRASLRLTPNGFPTLLSLLKNKKTKHFYPEILDAITQFNYDEASLKMMVGCGLIGVLVEKLAEFTKAHCRVHSEALLVETMGPMSPKSPTWSWPRSPSPPPLSPPLATSPSLADYSPRCSTPATDTGEDSDTPTPLMERSMSGDVGAGQDGSILDVLSRLTYQENPMRSLASKNCIITFLDYITGLEYPRYRSNFIKAQRTFTSIVAYLQFVVGKNGPPLQDRFGTIYYPLVYVSLLCLPLALVKSFPPLSTGCLARLFTVFLNNTIFQPAGPAFLFKTCKHFWATVLDDESVLEIHARLCRPLHQDCWECKRLNDTGRDILREIGRSAAQSGLGEGEITYRLMMTRAPQLRLTTALTFPHVVSYPNLLESLLYGHGGLRVLMEALSSRIEETVPSFHSLFSTLGVKNPQSSAEFCQSCEIGSIRKEGNILFSLDDGSTVPGNKESLSHSCPVFEAMFRGGFKESTQSSVRLSDISSGCLSHLIKILPEYCSCALPKELPVLLELISVTDRFLLPELTPKVVSFVRDSALSFSTAAQIYDWGVSVGQQYAVSTTLPHDVIKFLFAGKMLSAQRVSAVTALMDSENKDIFIQDLSTIIRASLTDYAKTSRFFKS